VGQQINLAFASALRRDLIALAGTRVEGMHAHPSPAQVAAVDIDALRRKRFSRAKAAYVTEAARAALDGRLDLEALAAGSAPRAEAALTAVRGIGTWTARYVLMRGCGFADCAPVGDVALAAALQRYANLPTRPGHAEVETLMSRFSPHRSLATFHLWSGLKD
jgi:3-methyladenine DNA glycosylase/8-oxoguanine DNA glycosylase